MEKIEQIIEERARELLEAHKQEVTQDLVYERFEADIRYMAESLAQQGLGKLKQELSDMAAQALYYEEESKKFKKEIELIKREYEALLKSKEELEHDRNLLYEANQRLIRENERLWKERDFDEGLADGQSFVTF